MQLLTSINQFLWGGPLLTLLLGTHLILTFHFRFPQKHLLSGLRYMLKTSGFRTITTTLAATLGTGNIIGVGTAVFFGGPGAVFWCWLTGILGMATTYAESYFALCHSKKNQDGYTGGTMYILANVFKKKRLASLYAFLICASSFLVGSTTQSNAIVTVCRMFLPIPPFVIGLATAILTGLVILRGNGLIEKVCMGLVPIMSLIFTGSCLYLLITHFPLLDDAVSLIVKSAFSYQAIGGGIVGFSASKACRYGIARGLFTNEAGIGTAGIVAAGAEPKNKKEQAALSMCAPFLDTVVLCGITGIVVVLFIMKNPDFLINHNAASLATSAFSIIPYIGKELLSFEILCFAVATLIGWSYIGLSGVRYFASKKGIYLYQLIYLLMIIVGAIFPLELVWEMTDFINALLVLPCVGSLLGFVFIKSK